MITARWAAESIKNIWRRGTLTDWKGEKLSLRINGASHDDFISAVIGGIKPGSVIKCEEIDRLLALRRPYGEKYSTSRIEDDEYEIVRGVEGGRANGDPIEIRIKNANVRSRDYDALKGIVRPGHADYAAMAKYGLTADLRGGGIFSGRLTAALCAAGGAAAGIIKLHGVKVTAYLSKVGGVKIASYGDGDFVVPEESGAFSAANARSRQAAEKVMNDAAKAGDSVGGIVECVVTGLPAGVGDAQFGSLESRISSLMFGIPAVKAVEFGLGCAFGGAYGSEVRDEWYYDGDVPKTKSNYNGGINGGISNGMPVCCRVTIKPTPSVLLPFCSIDVINHREVTAKIEGRHDACIAPRAVAAVESAVDIALLDALTED